MLWDILLLLFDSRVAPVLFIVILITGTVLRSPKYLVWACLGNLVVGLVLVCRVIYLGSSSRPDEIKYYVEYGLFFGTLPFLALGIGRLMRMKVEDQVERMIRG